MIFSWPGIQELSAPSALFRSQLGSSLPTEVRFGLLFRIADNAMKRICHLFSSFFFPGDGRFCKSFPDLASGGLTPLHEDIPIDWNGRGLCAAF